MSGIDQVMWDVRWKIFGGSAMALLLIAVLSFSTRTSLRSQTHT